MCDIHSFHRFNLKPDSKLFVHMASLFILLAMFVSMT